MEWRAGWLHVGWVRGTQEAAKQRALRVLKQKKLYESQRDQLYSQQFNLDQVSFTTQNMQDTANQVKAMKAANKELKVAFKSKVRASTPAHHPPWTQVSPTSNGKWLRCVTKTGWAAQDLDVNRIEAMQDEMSDLMEQSNEIQDVLGRNYSVPDDLDEEARKAARPPPASVVYERASAGTLFCQTQQR
jgi:charged multivesicular body protein 5